MSTTTDMAEFQAHSKAISELYLDGQPYDRQRVINEARFCLAQSAEAMLEAGKRLIVLKEHEGHGQLTRIVEEELGMNARVARRMMVAATRYLSPKLASKSKALAHLGKSKLYELMMEDDDELAALAEGGTVAGLELDDIDRMSARELRKALRDARADDAAKDQVIADKNKKLDELATKKKRLKPTTPDEDSKAIRMEAGDLCFQAEAMIRGQVAQALSTVQEHGLANNVAVEEWLAGQLNQLDEAINVAREAVGVFRPQQGVEWEQGGGA